MQLTLKIELFVSNFPKLCLKVTQFLKKWLQHLLSRDTLKILLKA